MIDAIRRFATLGVWAPPVLEFLQRPKTLDWLEQTRLETQRSMDETVLLLLCALRYHDLTLLDGGTNAEQLADRMIEWGPGLKELCRTKHVQANVAERALPILEVLGQRWGRQRLAVLELGCSFGLLGRVLVSAATVLERFDRYFEPQQQRPSTVALVSSYHGIDLDPPDERWFLSCIPLADMRKRMARLVFEIPAAPGCTVVRGSAFDVGAWPQAQEDEMPVVLTSFMLYQLTTEQKEPLINAIQAYLAPRGGTWINLDVLVADGRSRFVVQRDGQDCLELKNDLCPSWKAHA